MHVLEADADLAPRATLLLPDDVHSLALLRGRGLDDDERDALREGLVVYCDDDPSLPDWFFAGVAPVVSSRALAALAALGVDNFEAYPVSVERDDGAVTPGFHALNVVGRVACVDLDASEHTTFDGSLFKLETMRLAKSLPPDVVMFRPHEWTLVILVRDELADALRQSGLTGMRLTPVDDWVNRDF
jgi:hypothetical protein